MTDMGKDYDTARKVVAEFLVLHGPEGYLLLEDMLADLGFDELLSVVKAARALKRGYDTREVITTMLLDNLRDNFHLSENVIQRTMDDIRIGAARAFAPLSGDILDALSGVLDHENRDEDYYYSSLYAVWLREPRAIEKAIDRVFIDPAQRALARELASRPGVAMACANAWPSEWFGEEGPRIMLALRHEWDGAVADMAVFRPNNGGPGIEGKVFVFCRRQEEHMIRLHSAGGVIVAFPPIIVENDPVGCADEVLKRLPSLPNGSATS